MSLQVKLCNVYRVLLFRGNNANKFVLTFNLKYAVNYIIQSYQ